MASLHPRTWGLLTEPKHDEYDFIVIGGGSAGCAVASRLSEDRGVSVLLLEAGSHGLELNSRVPLACGKLQHTDLAWNDFTEPQTNAFQGLVQKKSYWPRGKCLGGSSNINYMAYVRGAPQDYDSWAELVDDPEWSYERVLPVLKRMERKEFDPTMHSAEKLGLCKVDHEFHGRDGPMGVSIREPVPKLAADFVQACGKSGMEIGDYNGAKLERAGLMQSTVSNGERCSTADGYIFPNLHRPNLHVVCNAMVHRVLFDEAEPNAPPRAYGCEIELAGAAGASAGKIRTVKCRREIIVSSSAVGSPLLLMRSGVGPKEELAKHGIPCVVDNQHVGRHLEDHPVLLVMAHGHPGKEHEMESVNNTNAELPPQGLVALGDWLVRGKGVLASSAYDATCFFKTHDGVKLPDGQIGGFMSPANLDLLTKNCQINGEGYFREEMLKDDGQGFLFVNTLLHPFSKGEVSLRDRSPHSPPIIQANYFEDPRDVQAMVDICLQSVELAEKMDLVGGMVLPQDLQHHDLRSPDLWREMIRRYASTLYHPASTCKMGLVCESDLTLKGATGIRVADASVMPHLVSGNTNCASILIGEKCADFVAHAHSLTLGGVQPEPMLSQANLATAKQALMFGAAIGLGWSMGGARSKL